MAAPYRLVNEGEQRVLPISPTSFRTREPGTAELYSVQAEKGTFLFLSYVKWESGLCEVRVEEAESNVDRVYRLTHGLRLSIESVHYADTWYDAVALRSARIQEDGTWSNLFDVSLPEIDKAADFPAIDRLKELGVQHIIHAHEIPGRTTRRTRRLFALYPKGDREIPLNAFIITRLMPLLNRVLRSDQLKLF